MKYKILLEYQFMYPWHNFDNIIICKWFKRKKILEHNLWCYTCVNLFIACTAFGLYSKSFSFLQKETTRKVSVLTIQRKYGTYDNKPNKNKLSCKLKKWRPEYFFTSYILVEYKLNALTTKPLSKKTVNTFSSYKSRPEYNM